MTNKKLGIILAASAIGMFAFGYGLVPVYNVLCKQLGINGKPSLIATKNDDSIDYSRTVTVQFLASRNQYLPWKFVPLIKSIKVHPGENTKVAYYAENLTDGNMIVQAIPSVTPGLAASHLKKTECFCFTQQLMKSKQGMQWPLLFHIDKDLPKNIHTVTLAYTLFDITKTAKKIKVNQTPGRISN